MWLDDTASTVIESSCWSELLWKEKFTFSVEISSCGTSVDTIPHGVRAKHSSKSIWSLCFSFLRIGRSNEISEFIDSILLNKFKACNNVTLHVGVQIWEKWLSFMLLVELVGLLRFREFAHFQFWNGETVLVDCINDFTSLSVTVRLDHAECPSSNRFKFVLCENISIINDLELSRVNSDDRSKEKLLHWKGTN